MRAMDLHAQDFSQLEELRQDRTYIFEVRQQSFRAVVGFTATHRLAVDGEIVLQMGAVASGPGYHLTE